MQQPIKDGGGDDSIAEDLVPLTETPVASKDDRTLFVPARNDLEQQMSAVRIDGDVPDLIEDQKPGHAKLLELLLQPVPRARGGDPEKENDSQAREKCSPRTR